MTDLVHDILLGLGALIALVFAFVVGATVEGDTRHHQVCPWAAERQPQAEALFDLAAPAAQKGSEVPDVR